MGRRTHPALSDIMVLGWLSSMGNLKRKNRGGVIAMGERRVLPFLDIFVFELGL